VAEPDGAAAFIAKWRAWQPQMALLEPFCAPAQRSLLAHWGALLHEWELALVDTSDAGVAATKLAWWGEDLAGGSRHPLGRALLADPVARAIAASDWSRLARAAIALVETARAADGQPLPAAALDEYSERLAGIEAQLFAAPSLAAPIAAGLALARLQRAAEADPAPALALLQRAPAQPDLNLYRAGQWAFDRWALQRIAAGTAPAAVGRPPAWRALLLAWGAARRSRPAS
jgi:15-cis-phytoene synthase